MGDYEERGCVYVYTGWRQPNKSAGAGPRKPITVSNNARLKLNFDQLCKPSWTDRSERWDASISHWHRQYLSAFNLVAQVWDACSTSQFYGWIKWQSLLATYLVAMPSYLYESIWISVCSYHLYCDRRTESKMQSVYLSRFIWIKPHVQTNVASEQYMCHRQFAELFIMLLFIHIHMCIWRIWWQIILNARSLRLTLALISDVQGWRDMERGEDVWERQKGGCGFSKAEERWGGIELF